MFYVRVPIVTPSKGKVTDDMLRLIVWVVADGTLVDYRKYVEGSSKRRVQFKLSRQEKIECLRALLDRIGIRYTFAEAKKGGVNKLQPYYVRIYGDTARQIFDLLSDKKEFPAWFHNLSQQQTRTVIETIAETDGSWRWRNVQWNTTSKQDANTMLALCGQNGIGCRYRARTHASGFTYNCKEQYHVTIGPLREDRRKKA